MTRTSRDRRSPLHHASASGSSEILSDLLCALWSRAIELKFRETSHFRSDNDELALSPFNSHNEEWLRLDINNEHKMVGLGPQFYAPF